RLSTRARRRAPDQRTSSPSHPLTPPVSGGSAASLEEEPGPDPVPAVAGAGRQEEVGATGRHHVVDERLPGEALLDRLELALEVPLEADEDQSLVELSSLVQPARVVVAAAEDPAALGLRRARAGGSDVGVERDPLPLGVVLVARVGELARAPE